jgi:molybdopterin-guanine dinucleotide biosynthesis protein B
VTDRQATERRVSDGQVTDGRVKDGRMIGRRVFGVTGWKNAGKTTLVERLVAAFVRRGWRVATVKHAHHDVDIDRPGTDSFRHRAAGATEVALVGGRRYAIMREQEEPGLEEVMARLAPADLVLIEGFKREPHPKIEVRAADADRPPMAPGDPSILAVAADVQPADGQPADGQPADGALPWFHRDDIEAIADFIADRLGR